jgi:hypothetical protein
MAPMDLWARGRDGKRRTRTPADRPALDRMDPGSCTKAFHDDARGIHLIIYFIIQ